jgi:mannose-6-phosphate isomerase
VDGLPDHDTAMRYHGELLVIPRDAEMQVDGECVSPGQCALAPSIDDIVFAPQGHCLITQPVPGTR